MKVNVVLTPPLSEDSFADIILCFSDTHGNTKSVKINIEFQKLFDFTRNTKSEAFDFFLISSIVYGTDSLLDRYEYSIDGWARDIEISFPVNNLKTWHDSKEALEQLLSFLTGDYWTVHFFQSGISIFYNERKGRQKSKIPVYNYEDISFVSLFSGGLDSLVGVIDELGKLQSTKKGLLISHFDSTSPGPSIDQHRLFDYLNQQTGSKDKLHWIQTVVSLSTHDVSGNEINKESSYRSRSLLFITLGIFCIESLPNCRKLLIPENGTISVNYPLTPSRSGTLSTRTTHPFYLEKLQELIHRLRLNIQLDNSYKFFTKGELVNICSNKLLLTGIYVQSVSCGKRGRKQHWDNKIGTSHCGICMPCIYRRAALHKINADNQLYGVDIFTTQRNLLDLPDLPALFDFLRRPLSHEDIKRTLLVNGSFDLNSLDDYAGLIERVRVEILKWIKDKGNANLKSNIGIK